MSQFRWFPHSGHRHAVVDTLAASHNGDTLCGLPVVASQGRLPEQSDWCSRECVACDNARRTAEHVPLSGGKAARAPVGRHDTKTGAPPRAPARNGTDWFMSGGGPNVVLFLAPSQGNWCETCTTS
jgi:hypothetical protein